MLAVHAVLAVPSVLGPELMLAAIFMYLFLTNMQLFTSQYVMFFDWSGVDYLCFYQLVGFWQHPFAAEDPLVSK